ncbi:MAG: phage major capsid protein [Gemmataceae bacterium]
MKSLKELYAERTQLVAQNRALAEREANGRLSAEQEAEYHRRDADIDKLTAEINSRSDHSLTAKNDRYTALLEGEPIRQTGRVARHGNGSIVEIGRHAISIPAGTALNKLCGVEYEAAYEKYLTGESGDKLGLVTSKDDKGGYAAPMAMASRLIKFVDDRVFMRQLATVLPPIPEAVSLGAVSWDTDPGDADWSPEVPASDISEDDTARLGKRELRPHLDTKLVKASDKFLRAAATLPGGAANFIADRLGYKFAVTEEKAFLTGDGNQKPLGVFVASNDGIPTSRDFVCAGATDFTADEVVNSLYALKTQYQDRATGLFSREFIRRLRLKKDGNGQYLWQPGLVAGQPDRVLNRPYVQSEFVPSTFTAGQYVGMWGDFSLYWIVDSLGMSVERLNELFRMRNQRGFLGSKETDGQPVLAEGFSRIRLA